MYSWLFNKHRENQMLLTSWELFGLFRTSDRYESYLLNL